MARANPFEFYTTYRFQLTNPAGESIGIERIWSDPFEPDCLWLVRGHEVGTPMLDKWLWGCQQADDSSMALGHVLTVTMLATLPGQEPSPDRQLHIRFSHWKWLPLDLDAKSAGVAREHVKLMDVEYVRP